MKNKLNYIFLIFIFNYIINFNAFGAEIFNFDVTELEIIEEGNKFIGKNGGTVTSEDGTVIKGVSRSNRLRTVLGMFYRDRHDKFAEISKLRNMVVLRDQELREYQNLFAKEKELKENLEDQLADVTIKLKGEQGDSDLEKKERKAG